MSKGTITYTAYRVGALLNETPYVFRKSAKQFRKLDGFKLDSGREATSVLKEGSYVIGKMTMKDGTKHTYIYTPLPRYINGKLYITNPPTEACAEAAFKQIITELDKPADEKRTNDSFYFVLNEDTRDKEIVVYRPGLVEFWEEAIEHPLRIEEEPHFSKRAAFYAYDSPLKEWIEDELVDNQWREPYHIHRRNREVKQIIYQDHYARWGDYVFPVNVKRAERFWSHNLNEVMKVKEAVPITDLRKKDNELNEAIIAEAMKPERVAKALEAYGEAYFENC